LSEFSSHVINTSFATLVQLCMQLYGAAYSRSAP
jgi:hypothetical protein